MTLSLIIIGKKTIKLYSVFEVVTVNQLSRNLTSSLRNVRQYLKIQNDKCKRADNYLRWLTNIVIYLAIHLKPINWVFLDSWLREVYRLAILWTDSLLSWKFDLFKVSDNEVIVKIITIKISETRWQTSKLILNKLRTIDWNSN